MNTTENTEGFAEALEKVNALVDVPKIKLAKTLGVSKQAVTNALSGRRWGLLVRIADHYGYTLTKEQKQVVKISEKG